MSRLITYGCSFTSYKWSTWADILAEQLDLPLINRGRVASGNNWALYRLKYDIETGLVQKDDVIRIMWCVYNRVSNIIDVNNFTFFHAPTDKKKKVKNFLNNIEIIKQTEEILQSYDYEFFTQIDLKEDGVSMKELTKDISQIENYEMPQWKKPIQPPLVDVIMQGNWNKRIDFAIDLINVPAIIKKNLFRLSSKHGKTPVELIREKSQMGDGKFLIFFDYHPTPLMHLEYLQAIYPQIVWKKELVDKIHQENQQILSKLHNSTSPGTVASS